MTEEEFVKYWGKTGVVYRIYVGNFGDYIDVDDVKFDEKTQKITMFLKGVKIGVFGMYSFEIKNGKVKSV